MLMQRNIETLIKLSKLDEVVFGRHRLIDLGLSASDIEDLEKKKFLVVDANLSAITTEQVYRLSDSAY